MMHPPRKVIIIKSHSSEKKLKNTYNAILLIMKLTSARELARAYLFFEEILDS